MKFLKAFALIAILGSSQLGVAEIIPGGSGSPATLPDGVTGGLTTDTLTVTGGMTASTLTATGAITASGGLTGDLDTSSDSLTVNTAGSCGSGNVCSGTYTGTCTKVQGSGTCDATTNGVWNYMRVGNMVTVVGQLISTGHTGSDLLGIKFGVPFNVAINGNCTGVVIMNEGTVQDPANFANVQNTGDVSQPCNARWNTLSTSDSHVSVFAMYDISQ